MPLPRIAITMGDPCGVGPEIIAGAWSETRIHDICRPLVVGHVEIMRQACQLRNSSIEVCSIDSVADANPSRESMPVLNCVDDDVLQAPRATVDRRAGQAAYEALTFATKRAIDRQIDAIVTAPLNKAALWQAGHHYPGHTELLAEMCGVEKFAMMLYLSAGLPLVGKAGLGVAHVTLHTSMRSVPDQITQEAVLSKIHLADNMLRRLGATDPKIGVAALNPHAGEDGLFGTEEKEIISPAVHIAREQGFRVEGPLPADTLMIHARDGEFDAVVAMFHDQGHIALKLLGMHRAVNITLGLPIIRTSVAHGTAFDLAWQGKARSDGMIEAMRTAAKLANSAGKG